MASIRQKLKRRFSHKDKELNFDDDVDSADEETSGIIAKELDKAENDDTAPLGRPGTLLNRMLSHGNDKTEKQLQREAAEAEAARQARLAGGNARGATTATTATGNNTTATTS